MTTLRPEAKAATKLRIRRHEGTELVPYRDSKGIWTVGIGHKMTNPLPDEVVELLFEHDYQHAEKQAQTLPVWDALSDARKGVLVEMVFQMGLAGVSGFKKFLAAAERADWDACYDEMLDSQWAREDSPSRALSLAWTFLRG